MRMKATGRLRQQAAVVQSKKDCKPASPVLRLAEFLCRAFLTFPQQPPRLLAELGPEVSARERVGEVGGEEADLGAAVEALAVELQAIERLRLGELDHGVGELDLATG